MYIGRELTCKRKKEKEVEETTQKVQSSKKERKITL